MDDLRPKLIQAVFDYGNSDSANDFDAEDMADYLMEVINWSKYINVSVEAKDVILDTYNNLMICPHCNEIINTAHDWTPKYCKECGNPLSGGNQYKE